MTNIFVSYSHADKALVSPVVQLLRVNKSFVFQDINGIQPGKKWRSEIAGAITNTDLVIVFWCDHSCLSNEVRDEWKTAIKLEKDLLPLLLDSTPLPPELGEYQWIDFQGTVGKNHKSIELGDAYIFGDIFGSADGGKTIILEPRRESIDNESCSGFEHSIASEVEKEILRRRKQ